MARSFPVASATTHGVESYGAGMSVMFPTISNFSLKIIGAKLTQKVEHHDILEMTFLGRLPDINSKVQTGTPVKFTYYSPNHKSEWVGYVHHVIPAAPGVTPIRTVIVATGASYVLKDSSQKVYTDVTADQVVSKVAKLNKLKANTERHPKVFPTVSNTGQSEWQLLRRLAKQTGFGLVMDNTSIKFMSKERFFQDSLSKGLYFSYEADNLQLGLPTVLSFAPRVNQGSPDQDGASVNRVITGLHQVTGEAIATSHSPASTARGRGVKGAG